MSIDVHELQPGVDANVLRDEVAEALTQDGRTVPCNVHIVVCRTRLMTVSNPHLLEGHQRATIARLVASTAKQQAERTSRRQYPYIMGELSLFER